MLRIAKEETERRLAISESENEVLINRVRELELRVKKEKDLRNYERSKSREATEKK